MMTTTSTDRKMHRVVTFLDRDDVDLLDKIGKDALFSTGAKFPRTKIMASLIRLLRYANTSGEGIRTEQDFEERLLRALQRMASGTPHHEAAA